MITNFPTQVSLCFAASSAQKTFKHLWLSPERNVSEFAVSEAEDEAWPGQVSDVGISWLVMDLVNLDMAAPPGLYMVSDLRDSVPEPDLKDLLVALHGRDCALGVAEEGDPARELGEPRQDRGDESGEY